MRLLGCAVTVRVVLSERPVPAEMPGAIGWKRTQRSVVVECKGRRRFLADRTKRPFSHQPGNLAWGANGFTLTVPDLLRIEQFAGTAGELAGGARGRSRMRILFTELCVPRRQA